MAGERGFTMIEVLVVMIVLSLGILGVLQATLLAVRLEDRSRAVTAGTFLAQEFLESVGAAGWEAATAGVSAGTLPASLGIAGQRLQREVAGPGCRLLLVFEREPEPEPRPLCTVRCYRAGVGEDFDPRPLVALSARRPR